MLLYAYKGRSVLSRLIRWWTGGEYSHVGIVVDMVENIPVVVEAWKGRVRLGDPRQVHKEGTSCDIFEILLPELEACYLKCFLLAQVNKRYDLLAILDFLYSWKFMKFERLLQHRDKWFCSELVAAAFNLSLKEKPFPRSLVSPSEVVCVLIEKGLIESNKC